MDLITQHPQLVRRMLCYEPAWEGKRTLSHGLRAVLPPIIFADERGPVPDPQVIENIGPDKEMMTAFDWKLIAFYKRPLEALRDKPILFAVGEQSKRRRSVSRKSSTSPSSTTPVSTTPVSTCRRNSPTFVSARSWTRTYEYDRSFLRRHRRHAPPGPAAHGGRRLPAP